MERPYPGMERENQAPLELLGYVRYEMSFNDCCDLIHNVRSQWEIDERMAYNEPVWSRGKFGFR